MTPDQTAILFRLQRVTMPVASYDKRFRRNMHAGLELTEKQAAYLLKLDHRYRRQTGGAHICTPLCATYTRRQTGECFEAPLPPKPPTVTHTAIGSSCPASASRRTRTRRCHSLVER